MDKPFQSATVRAEVRETLVREFLLRSFAHDVRGAVMGVMGWVELMSMEGTAPPQGLQRSVDKLNAVVSRSEDAALAVETELGSFSEIVRSVLAIPVVGEDLPVMLSPLRLLAALELAAPTAIALSTEVRGGRLCLRAQLHDLPAAGVQLAMTPHFEELVEHAARRDAAMGVGLLRVVTRTSGAELRGEPPNRVSLYFPLP